MWAVDLLHIIAIASRSFAAYDLLQTLAALLYDHRDRPPQARLTVLDKGLLVALAVVLAGIVLRSAPAG